MQKSNFPFLFYLSVFALLIIAFVVMQIIRSTIPAEDICSLMPIEGDTCIDSNPNNQLAIRLFVLNLFGGIAAAILAAIFFAHLIWANMRNSGSGL